MAWIDAKDWKKARLVHELAFAAKGQYTFGDKRLAPQYEDVVGGSSTVRGYPESTAVGDTTVMGTFEYRFHLPRILKPSSVSDFAAPVESVAPTAPEASQGGDVKPRFATRPPAILAKPDWDLIFRTFLDAGWTHNNKRDLSTEVDRSLTGAGVGVEVQVSRYVNLRCDWGFALEAVDDKLMSKPVKAGDSRIHVQASIVW
jgi:hemolysin activation/secretion protein